MRHAKGGQWWVENPEFALANNSVCYTEKPTIETFMREWLSLIESKSGERGIFNREAANITIPERRKEFGYTEWGTNPSLRGGTKVWTTDGVYPIESLENKSFLVRNLNGEISEASCWLSGNNKPLYKVELQGGHEYYSTKEHEWPVTLSDNSVKKKKTDELNAL